MTTDPAPDPAARAAEPDPTAAVFRRALRDTAVLLGALAVLGIGLGALVAGVPGVWGALIGVGLALVFSGTTVVAMLRTLHSPPHTMAAVVMGTWLAKVLVVVVVLALLRDLDFYSRGVLAAVLALGVVGSAVLDFRAVNNGRVPYVEPGATGR
ncbi:MAG: hypothetical protein IR158_13685 [Cellulomonas sp.]|jgi:hypothetical protein|uniref:hypothetical protein n=1 Tax=Cellulomonas sp. TaxID=40001 RepID=UPI0019FB2401|nr:hypothetical protein [Cellulomonas sp.]MBF0688802.1 hypothetical protein [Cellulomonas sp.]